jgi:hypothetical protein
LLRPGNAGANTAADHKTVLADALAQLPGVTGYRAGKKILIRANAGGGTHEFLNHLTSRRLAYSIGFGLTATMAARLALIPAAAWAPAYDSGGGVRDVAWVAEATGVLDLPGWPAGMRVIVRKERPHPGAQLRFTDHEGLRLTAFVTNTRTGQLPDLELRHRRRARCEDRIRAAKETGLTKLPPHGFDANRVWLAIVQLACDLMAWTQMLALPDHPARRWEPKRLRLRLFSIAARLTRHARRTQLRLRARPLGPAPHSSPGPAPSPTRSTLTSRASRYHRTYAYSVARATDDGVWTVECGFSWPVAPLGGPPRIQAALK